MYTYTLCTHTTINLAVVAWYDNTARRATQCEYVFRDRINHVDIYDDHDFHEFWIVGCIRDVRLNRQWFPMTSAQNPDSTVADMVNAVNVGDVCNSTACQGVACVEGVCSDIWRQFMCMYVNQALQTTRKVDVEASIDPQ